MSKDLFTQPHPAIPSKLALDEQHEIVELLRRYLSENQACKPWRPTLRSGVPMRLKIFSFGRQGWTYDRAGSRYITYHPENFLPFPPVPSLLANISTRFGLPDPDTCLVNMYDAAQQDCLGLHRDDTEKDLEAPIVSLSLGASCIFLLGGRDRADEQERLTLSSGDVMVLSGERRLAWHGVEKIMPGTGPKDLLDDQNKRVNLTFRRVLPISL